jgi:hypothetical protein
MCTSSMALHVVSWVQLSARGDAARSSIAARWACVQVDLSSGVPNGTAYSLPPSSTVTAPSTASVLDCVRARVHSNVGDTLTLALGVVKSHLRVQQ